MIAIGEKVLVKKYSDVLQAMIDRKYYKNLKQRREVAAMVSGKICTVEILNSQSMEASISVDEVNEGDKVAYAIPLQAIEDKSDPDFWAKVLASKEKIHKQQILKLKEKIRQERSKKHEVIKSMFRLTSNYTSKVATDEPYDAEEEELMNYIKSVL